MLIIDAIPLHAQKSTTPWRWRSQIPLARRIYVLKVTLWSITGTQGFKIPTTTSYDPSSRVNDAVPLDAQKPITPRRWRPPRPLAPCLYVLTKTTVNQGGSLSLVSRLRPFDKLGHKKLNEHASYRLPTTRRDPPTHMPSTTIAQGARKPLEV